LPNSKISFEHLTPPPSCGGEDNNIECNSAHVKVEHKLSNGIAHPFARHILGTQPFSQ